MAITYAILHIPPSTITSKYNIGCRFCNLAIGDGDMNCFHITENYDLITGCLSYYRNRFPNDTYRIFSVEEI